MSDEPITMTAKKPFTYGTRRLLPGDDFLLKRPKDGIILKALKKADYPRAAGELPPPPPALKRKVEEAHKPAPPVIPSELAPKVPSTSAPEQPAVNEPAAPVGDQPAPSASAQPAAQARDLAKLRTDYEAKFGKRPFNGWKAEKLIELLGENG
jgi:hypothetical protein